MQARDRLTDLLNIIIELDAVLAGLIGPHWQQFENQLILLLRELEANPDRRESTYTRILLLLTPYANAHLRVVEALDNAEQSEHAHRSVLVDLVNRILRLQVR